MSVGCSPDFHPAPKASRPGFVSGHFARRLLVSYVPRSRSHLLVGPQFLPCKPGGWEWGLGKVVYSEPFCSRKWAGENYLEPYPSPIPPGCSKLGEPHMAAPGPPE